MRPTAASAAAGVEPAIFAETIPVPASCRSRRQSVHPSRWATSGVGEQRPGSGSPRRLGQPPDRRDGPSPAGDADALRPRDGPGMPVPGDMRGSADMASATACCGATYRIREARWRGRNAGPSPPRPRRLLHLRCVSDEITRRGSPAVRNEETSKSCGNRAWETDLDVTAVVLVAATIFAWGASRRGSSGPT